MQPLPPPSCTPLRREGAHPFRPISLFSRRRRHRRRPPPPRGTLQSRSLAAAAALSETCSGGGGSNGNEMVDASSSSSAAQISIYGIEDEGERERERERGGCSFLSGNVHTQVLYLFPLVRNGELYRDASQETENGLDGLRWPMQLFYHFLCTFCGQSG